ncbi:unnamed protein product [Thelazia callipaeda]|uniref:Oxysterol-binding protein n=1 Tax=Thelazia callipaeda TaxID=103827 RepID=A0A158RC44_THECL|nr:unnamed protein product [Thelazia callipaeda]
MSRRAIVGTDVTVPKIIATSKKLSKISKKLTIKKERPVPMVDLPADAPPVDCPPVYECYVLMKPHKKHRISITKRYIGKVARGVMRLTPEKSVKTNNDAIGSEYTVDLTAIAISCDDAKRRLIFKFKKESRDIGPVNKDEYEIFKEMIQKHRNYRQSAYRNKKEDVGELVNAKADYGNDSNPATAVLDLLIFNEKTNSSNFRFTNITLRMQKRSVFLRKVNEQEVDQTKVREDCRLHSNFDLNEKVLKISNDIKAIAVEVKQIHKELKDMIRFIQSGRLTFSAEFKEPQKLSEEEDSVSDDSEEKLELAAAYSSQPYVFEATPRAKVKTLQSEDLAEKKDEKVERFLEAIEAEKVAPRKRRDHLPKPSLPTEELGFRQLMAIVARRAPIPIAFFEPLTMLQVICEELRYSGQTLNKALSAIDPVDRIAYVTAFAVSGYAGMVCRKQKPFNPLLGETFDYISSEGWKYHAEQVSHHPAISAAHAEGLNWAWWQTLISTPKTSWSGTIEATPELPVRVRLGNEDYCWNRVKVIIENASSTAESRRLRMDGTMNLRCSNGYTSTIVFRKDRQTEISGSIIDSRGTQVVKLIGQYDRFLQKANEKDYLFEAIPLPKNASQFYGFSQFACGLNDFINDEKASVPPTDSRLRPDLKALESADLSRAVEAKNNLEKAQRTRDEANHKRMWFEQRQDIMANAVLWVCNGRYWQAKEKKFKGYPDILQLFWFVQQSSNQINLLFTIHIPLPLSGN